MHLFNKKPHVKCEVCLRRGTVLIADVMWPDIVMPVSGGGRWSEKPTASFTDKLLSGTHILSFSTAGDSVARPFYSKWQAQRLTMDTIKFDASCKVNPEFDGATSNQNTVEMNICKSAYKGNDSGKIIIWSLFWRLQLIFDHISIIVFLALPLIISSIQKWNKII